MNTEMEAKDFFSKHERNLIYDFFSEFKINLFNEIGKKFNIASENIVGNLDNINIIPFELFLKSMQNYSLFTSFSDKNKKTIIEINSNIVKYFLNKKFPNTNFDQQKNNILSKQEIKRYKKYIAPVFFKAFTETYKTAFFYSKNRKKTKISKKSFKNHLQDIKGLENLKTICWIEIKVGLKQDVNYAYGIINLCLDYKLVKDIINNIKTIKTDKVIINNFETINNEKEITIKVSIGNTILPFDKIKNIKKDMHIDFDKYIGEKVDIFANGKHIAKGDICVRKKHEEIETLAVRITDIK